MNSLNELIQGILEMVGTREQGKCPFCGISMQWQVFRDALSLREYQISGLCQACQDQFFGK